MTRRDASLLLEREPMAMLTQLATPAAPARSRTMEELFSRFGPMIHRQARRMLGSPEDARDVVQDVFVKLLDLGPSRWDRPEVSSFLYRVTFNMCLNRMRRSRRAVPLAEEFAGPFANPEHDRSLDLSRVLAEADAREALAAVCVWVEGMSHPEAAEVVGCSERTVRNLLSRFEHMARARLGAAREENR
jgi:RNA polymerase sigma-70 factor (ECF subfamily)